MKRLAIVLVLLLGACATTGPKISASLLASYDTAVAAEISALSTGKVNAEAATQLRACRVSANNAIQAVVAAENNGSASASVQSSAQTAVQAYLTAAQTLAGNGSAIITGCGV